MFLWFFFKIIILLLIDLICISIKKTKLLICTLSIHGEILVDFTFKITSISVDKG